MYMHNCESLMQPAPTREEKRLISDYKQFHRNMQREEWDQIMTHFIRFMNVDLSWMQNNNQSSANDIKAGDVAGFREFVALVNHWYNTQPGSASSSPSTSPSTSPSSSSSSLSGSLLTQSLLSSSLQTTSNMQSRTRDSANNDNNNQKSLPGSELLALYICSYYPNYQELFDGQHVILTNSLTNVIDQFVKQHPTIDSAILSALMSAIDDYFKVTQSNQRRVQ
jgi:hypothetical protein